MARDLYGEMLSRALQRQAPSGHFPAYITPFEAGLLRSRGGGVPPGGGQYMAGGIPAFFSPDDPGGGAETGASAGADMGDPEGTGTGTGAEAADPAASADMADVIGAMDVQPSDPHGHSFGTSAGQTAAEGLLDIDIAISEDVLGQIATNAQAAKGRGETSQNISMQNTQALLNAVNYGLISNAQAVSMAANDISQGGLGSMSPGGFAATPGNTQVAPTMEQIAQINLQNPETLDYAINVPNPQMGTVAFQNAITSSQAAADVGMTNIGMDIGLGLMSMAPGLPGLIGTGLSMATGRGLSNLMAPALSNIPGAGVVSEATSAVIDTLSDIASPVTQGISQGLNALGDVAEDVVGGLPDIGQNTDPGSPNVGGDIGGPDTPITPVPPVHTDTNQNGTGEPPDTVPPPIYDISGVDDAIRDRILANILAGLTRTGRPTEGVTAFGPLFTDTKTA